MCHLLQTHLSFVSSAPGSYSDRNVSSQSTDRGQRHYLLWHFFATAKNHYSAAVSDSAIFLPEDWCFVGCVQQVSQRRKYLKQKEGSSEINLTNCSFDFLFFLLFVCTSKGSYNRLPFLQMDKTGLSPTRCSLLKHLLTIRAIDQM